MAKSDRRVAQGEATRQALLQAAIRTAATELRTRAAPRHRRWALRGEWTVPSLVIELFLASID